MVVDTTGVMTKCSELDFGDTFMVNGKLYMLTDQWDMSGEAHMCLSLETGT